MNNSYSNADVDAIRQAQREWRIAKRREMEAKARKKAFKQRTVSGNEAAAALSSTTTLVHGSPPVPTTVGHTVHLTQAQMIQHGATDPATVAAVAAHAGVAAHTASEAAAAIAQSTGLVQTSASMTPVSQTQAAFSQGLSQHIDPASVAVTAAFHTHLNSAKRPRMALEDTVDEAVEVVASVAGTAAGVANPTEGHFVTSAPISASEAMQEASDVVEPRDEAHRQLLEQFEAQRRWREEKRREIALKKAKGSASKRGRKKMRRDPPVSQQMPQMAEAVVGQQPMTSQASMVGHMAVTYVPDVPTQHEAVLQQAQAAAKGEEHMMEDPTAMYVQTATGVHGHEEDTVTQHEQQGDVSVAQAAGDLPVSAIQGANSSAAFTTAEAGHDTVVTVVTSRSPAGALQTKEGESNLQEKPGAHAASRGFGVSADDELRASVEVALKQRKAQPGSEVAAQTSTASPLKRSAGDGHDVVQPNELQADVDRGDVKGEDIAEAVATAAAQESAHGIVEGTEQAGPQEVAHEGIEHGGGGGGIGGSSEGRGLPGNGSTASEEIQAVGAVDGDNNTDSRKEHEGTFVRSEQQSVELKVQQETTNAEEPEVVSGDIPFPRDGGDDLMTAAAWRSLDSIGHTDTRLA